MANESYIASLAGRNSESDSYSPWLALMDQQSMQSAGIYSTRDAAEVALSGYIVSSLNYGPKGEMAAQFVELGQRYVADIQKQVDFALSMVDVDLGNLVSDGENDEIVSKGQSVLQDFRHEILSLAEEVRGVTPEAMRVALIEEFEQQWEDGQIECEDDESVAA